MDSSVIFIFASSRSDGNTRCLLDCVNANHGFEVIDVSNLNISYFDYAQRNLDDDFLPVIQKIQKAKIIGFVSPMYWYSVSAQMKTFIDRFSDLLCSKKEEAASLKGKRTFLLATGSTEKKITVGMEEVISRTSNYMGMQYQGSFYAQVIRDRQIDFQTLKDANIFLNEQLTN